MRGKIVWGSVWQLSSGTEEGGGSLLFVWCQCECGSDQWNTVCSTSSCVSQGLSQTFPPSAAQFSVFVVSWLLLKLTHSQ